MAGVISSLLYEKKKKKKIRYIKNAKESESLTWPLKVSEHLTVTQPELQGLTRNLSTASGADSFEGRKEKQRRMQKEVGEGKNRGGRVDQKESRLSVTPTLGSPPCRSHPRVSVLATAKFPPSGVRRSHGGSPCPAPREKKNHVKLQNAFRWWRWQRSFPRAASSSPAAGTSGFDRRRLLNASE